MGLKQFLCVDMNPVAAPEMYLCPKLKKEVDYEKTNSDYVDCGIDLPAGDSGGGYD